MLPHQERVVAEKSDLDALLGKLDAFRRTDMFAQLPSDEQKRLNRQHLVMGLYIDILAERIAAFPASQAGG